MMFPAEAELASNLRAPVNPGLCTSIPTKLVFILQPVNSWVQYQIWTLFPDPCNYRGLAR